MKSLKELYRIGYGPSSSHTMAPRNAAKQYKKEHPEARRFRATLFGSLAATGKGHFTDRAIMDVLGEDTDIVWRPDEVKPFHPNALTLECDAGDGQFVAPWTVYSIGGGALAEEGKPVNSPDVYDLSRLAQIQQWCRQRGMGYWEYVDACEGPEIWDYLGEVWDVMQASVERGLQHEGVLPGGLNLRRKAPDYYFKATGSSSSLQSRGLVFAYALAVSEENAGGGKIVTAPTCGSSGVVPAVLYHLAHTRKFPRQRILHALAVAGLIGNVAKSLASISGAECGCQAEVGVACAMAAGAANYLFGGSLEATEYAAEMGLEHHLGMTCDPVCGLVQIPCIERNAHAAARALDANIYSVFAEGQHRVSYDGCVLVMRETGHDIPSVYRETAQGGLAKGYEIIRQRRLQAGRKKDK